MSDPLVTLAYANFTRAIILTGFNLEVAAAAAGAGFNTWNHHALYNLIWAVKRVALRHCHGPVNPPPPRNPYYPDRYRPSGLGDNTSKKRPAPPSEPPTTSSLKLELKPTSLKPKFRAFKYTKSKKKLNSRAAPYQVDEIVNRAGTRDNPVNLLLDGEEDGPPGKKQKLDSSNANDVKPQHSGAQTHGDTSRLSGLNVLTNTQRETRGGSLTQQTGFVSVVDGDLNEQDRMTGIATLSSWPSPSVSLCRGFAPAQSVTPVTRQLKLVRHELEFAVESMISSRIIMKKVFDDHGDLLNLEETMPALTFLSKCLHVAETEAEKGVKHVDRVVKLISRE